MNIFIAGKIALFVWVYASFFIPSFVAGRLAQARLKQKSKLCAAVGIASCNYLCILCYSKRQLSLSHQLYNPGDCTHEQRPLKLNRIPASTWARLARTHCRLPVNLIRSLRVYKQHDKLRRGQAIREFGLGTADQSNECYYPISAVWRSLSRRMDSHSVCLNGTELQLSRLTTRLTVAQYGLI